MQFFLMYWRRALRTPGTIYLWMLIPFVFMAIYQLAFGGSGSIARTGLAVVDADSSFVSKFVTRALGQGQLADFVEVKSLADVAAVEGAFADETASAALMIPKGFGEGVMRRDSVTVTLLTNPRHFVGPQIAEGIVGSLVTMGNGLLSVFGEPLERIQSYLAGEADVNADEIADLAREVFDLGEQAPNLAAVSSIDVKLVEPEENGGDDVGDDFNMATMFFPGLLVFGLLSVSLGLETRFLQDRVKKVTQRMIVAPVAPWNIVLQQRIYAVSFILLVAAVSAAVGGIMWGIEPIGLATVGLISVALALFIVGINGMIFSLSRSLKATSAISSMVMIALVSVGGGFFPAELTPGAFQRVSGMIPTGMANLGITRALTGRELTISLPLLFVYCAAFFVASLFLSRRRLA